MKKYSCFPLILIFLFIISINGCFLSNLNKPTQFFSPEDQYLIDIWPILSPQQKEWIENLKSAEEINQYIEEQWKLVDPTPETEINEIREEYNKRLDYVNLNYTYQKGWIHSDRARIYLKYGKPDDIHYINWFAIINTTGPNIYALEIWVYNELNPLGHLPNIFDNIDPNLMKFAFADFTGTGYYKQIYSNSLGGEIDSNVFNHF